MSDPGFARHDLCSMVVLYTARHRVPVPSLARWLLALGIAATLTANTAQGAWLSGPARTEEAPDHRRARRRVMVMVIV